MINEQYSDKEIIIFNGVINLMNEGINLHTIKASDIAVAANIGKGTLYNYFESKEEIIAKTIIYSMKIQFQHYLDLVDSVDTFKEKFYIGFQVIEESSKSKDFTFQLLLSSIGRKELSQFFKDGFQVLEDRKQIIRNNLLQLAEIGYKEGIIKKSEDEDYVYTVFISSLMGFSQVFCQCSKPSLSTIEKAKENSYKLLIKGLN